MKILVLGASGMWGHQAYLKLSGHFGNKAVAGVLRKDRKFYDKIGIFKDGTIFDNLDLARFENAEKVLNEFKPDTVVNCVGLTPRKYDIKNEELFFNINAKLPQKLNSWCETHSARLLHFSTDCVFTGKKGNYTEEDAPDAQDTYGKSKAEGEIQSQVALTFRLSKIGREIEGKTELVEWFLAQKGKSAKGFSKAYYSGVTTNFMAHELVRVIERFPNLTGLFQVSSPKITKYELLKLLNEVYDSKVEIEEKSDYAVDKSLNCELYERTTGFKKPNWKEMLFSMKKEESLNYDSFKP